MFFNIATQQTYKNQCKIKKYSQCSGFRSKHANFLSENAEYRSELENTAPNAVFLFFLVPNAVSGKFGGNRRLPTGKVNPDSG